MTYEVRQRIQVCEGAAQAAADLHKARHNVAAVGRSASKDETDVVRWRALSLILDLALAAWFSIGPVLGIHIASIGDDSLCTLSRVS